MLQLQTTISRELSGIKGWNLDQRRVNLNPNKKPDDRIERSTFWLRIRCSNHWAKRAISTWRRQQKVYKSVFLAYNLVRNHLLYVYQTILNLTDNRYHFFMWKKKQKNPWLQKRSGAVKIVLEQDRPMAISRDRWIFLIAVLWRAFSGLFLCQLLTRNTCQMLTYRRFCTVRNSKRIGEQSCYRESFMFVVHFCHVSTTMSRFSSALRERRADQSHFYS